MQKIAVVLLAGTEGLDAMGRMANALSVVKEFKESGDEVKLILDGAGVNWVDELTNPKHRYHSAYQGIRDQITGVCAYCANAFGVTEAVQAADLPFAEEHEGHPSFRQLLLDGFQVLTF